MCLVGVSNVKRQSSSLQGGYSGCPPPDVTRSGKTDNSGAMTFRLRASNRPLRPLARSITGTRSNQNQAFL